MTWVLILSPRATNGWPAVIGGYPSLREADMAGRIATMSFITQEMFEDEGYGVPGPGRHPGRVAALNAWAQRPWVAYTVVPGAAALDAQPGAV